MSRRGARVILALVATLGSGVVGVACGSGDDGASVGDGLSDGGQAPNGSLGEQAERGERIARSRGCAGCHGEDFDGASGPSWVGLAGSEVELVDGSTVVADRDYLARAIADPDAEVVSGYLLKMPANDLNDEQVADVVAYIESLSGG